jgi:hypothetical protein
VAAASCRNDAGGGVGDGGTDGSCHDAIIADCQRAADGQDHPATGQARR